MKACFASCLLLFIFASTRAQQPAATPVPIREEVVVTADKIETKIGDTPASVVVFSRAEMQSTAAPTIDETLRRSVGFSIFRRSRSRNANPTTQGVSLRGVGASGASRSLVLLDGVPLTDPFGGWVQWNRVPPVEVENVEILRGGASSLYGDASLSGAVNLYPRKVSDKFTISADAFGGSQGTISGAVFAGAKLAGWIGSVAVSDFQTKGFIPVYEAVRGPVDGFAGVRSTNLSARISRDFDKRASLFFRPSYFGEVRTNGTGLQINRTHIGQLVFGGDAQIAANHDVKVKWRTYGGSQVYDQTFTTINATRTAESLNRNQRVPAQIFGLSTQLSAVAGDHSLIAGFDFRNVRGASDEIAIANLNATSYSGAGGRQKTTGAFVEDFVRIGKRLVIVGSLRYDSWQNYAAQNVTRTVATGLTTAVKFPDRSENAVSPQGSVLYHISDAVSFYASASRSFRSPTLNELYRAFRVGSVLTTANENLKAEIAKNFESGVSIRHKSTSFRASGFWTAIDGAVSNVTLTTTPTLITRQRQNVGGTRSTGIEIEAETTVKQFNFSGGYLFAMSTVTAFPSNTQLVGLWIPQVARHQATFQAKYSKGKTTVALQGRASGKQFDDDLNQFRLEPYAQIDMYSSQRLSEKLQIYAAVENIFNTRYSVGKTPIRTVGSPINFRLGMRWN